MSGVEGAVAVAGASAPKILASIAGSAARAVTRRALFRWRVQRRAAQTLEFAVPGRLYRKWLKSLEPKNFSQPIEEVSNALALHLDSTLTERSPKWSTATDHLSRALQLVEATFPAIAAELKDSDYRQLTEQWAATRSSRPRERLFVDVGPDAALSPSDLAAALLRRSDARREVRLLAFDLGEVDLGTFFEQVAVPDVPAGKLRVLVGDFGAGKSEMAESWHRQSIRTLTSNPAAPMPAWLRARDMSGRPLDQTVGYQAGTGWRSGRGIDLVVDGLDETDPATAHALLEGARLLVRSFDNARVLITARPGAVTPESIENLTAPLLSDDAAETLIRLAGVHQHATSRWSSGMRATVRRPFFALAAGAVLTSDDAPRGEADLIRALVEDALAKGAERAAVASSQVYTVLRKMAVMLTDTTADAHLTFSERQIALTSRLVALGSTGGLTFALPIFQHWFAAQAMLQGDVAPTKAVTDPAGFNQWRWAAAVAVLSEQNIEALDDLISAWLTGNPGATGWILNEAFGSVRDRQPDGEPLDPTTSGPRLLRALRTWADALGPWAECVLPALIVVEPFELGVVVTGHRIAVGLSERIPARDTRAELPTGLNPFRHDPAADWRTWLVRNAPEGAAWPWLIVRDLVAESAIKSLENEPYLGGTDGVWGEERRYDMALKLTGQGSLSSRPISSDAVRERAVALLQRISPDGLAHVGSRRFTAPELDALVRWIDGTARTELTNPLPKADVPNPTGGWIWDMFTEEGLMAHEVEVYARACIAYDQAMADVFSAFDWSMATSRLHPMGVVLGLHYSDGFGGRTPGVTVLRVPMALIKELAPCGPEVIWSSTGRAVISREDDDRPDSWEKHQETIERIWDWFAEGNLEPPLSLGWSSTVADHMGKTRPSVAVAAGWLCNDLKNLGLATGTFPQLK